MIEFTPQYEKAKEIALHYAEQLNNNFIIDVLEGIKNITSSYEAVEFTKFFWDMTDLAAEDHKNDIEVAGVSDLEFWMEKLMNIFIGHLKKIGFYQSWVDESNKINSGSNNKSH